MSEIEQLEQRIKSLPPGSCQLSGWHVDFDAQIWDAQIEADAKGGKLGGLINEALADYQAGKAREL